MFSYHSIAQYHNDLQQNKFSCTDAVHFYLQQIEVQKQLNVFIEVYAAEALEKANQLDTQRTNNPEIPLKALHGVVLSLKDVLCYKDHKVSAGSKMLENFTAIYTATAVQKLLDADAIIIGNVNCDEFAMGSGNENSYYGPTLNAADNTKVPGGSSGGSAVSVQASLCMISLGSDTGGSVRQPADHCGIVGYKPSYGVVSRYGLIAYASSFDQIGILSNTVADVTTVLEIISGNDAYDTTALPNTFNKTITAEKPKKIAYFKEAIQNDALDPEIKNGILEKINSLKEKGFAVEEIDFPLMPYLIPTYYILTTAEASSNLNRYDGIKFGYRTNTSFKNLNEFYTLNRTEGFGKEVKKRIMLGSFVLSSGYYDAYFTKAQQVRKKLVDFMNDVFTTYDYIVMPNAPTTAPSIGAKDNDPLAVYIADVYTVLANLVGAPSIAVPLATHSNGLPFGVQILAAQQKDSSLLHFSTYYL